MGRRGIICHNALKAQIDTHLKKIGTIMHEMEIYVNRSLRYNKMRLSSALLIFIVHSTGTCFVSYMCTILEKCVILEKT